MSKLNTKLIRDITTSPLMFGGIVFLVLVGIALFGASYALYLNLEGSYARSYRELHLADVTIPVQSAPSNVVAVLRRIPGVARAEGRVVREVELAGGFRHPWQLSDDAEGRMVREVELEQPDAQRRKLTGRVISLPDAGTPRVNQLKVIAGAWPGRDARREVLVEASFAEYHGYHPGDLLRIVIRDDEVRFRIAGVVQSPEYIYVVRGSEYPMPSPGTFAVMWMRKAMVDELFATSGAINEVAFTMTAGGNRRTAMRLAERVLQPYGPGDPVPQEELPSVELLRLDLIGLKNLAVFFPVLFLTIAGMSISNILSRMVHAQRTQIGFLRAVGFSRRAIGVHYALFSLLVGGLGGFLGSIAGHLLGGLMTRYYTQYIQVPYSDVAPRWSVLLGGVLLATAVTVGSGLFSALAAGRLAPAEAIRPEAPALGRGPLLERFLPALRSFSLRARLPLRNVLRSPRRTLGTVAGVASAAILLLVSSSLLDSTQAAIDFYFAASIRYDILTSYLHPQGQFTLERIRRWPGVRRAEGVLAVPAKLVKGGESQTLLIYGVEPDSRLLTLATPGGRAVPIQPRGLMIAESTAKKLGLWGGSPVRLTLPRQVIAEVPEAPTAPVLTLPAALATFAQGPGYRARVLAPGRALLETELDRMVHISGVTYQPMGAVAYASLDQVRRWYGRALELPPNAVNAVAISADPRYTSAIERRLHRLDGVASVEVTRTMREEIDKLMEQSRVFFIIMLSFSVALAGVIVFNATLMNVIERTREIATLRTLGLSVGAAARMIGVENLLAYALGILLGVPAGRWLAGLFVGAYESESFNLRTVIFLHTYLITVGGILVTVLVAQFPGIRYIRGIELAKATKDVG